MSITIQNLTQRCRAKWGVSGGTSTTPITVLQNKYDGRLGSARNTAVESTSGEIVAFLDDDAAAHVDWLKFLVDPYRRTEVVAVGGAPLPVFETYRPSWFPPQLDWVFGCYYAGLPHELSSVKRLIGASMSVRRGALESIGGFHSDDHDDMDMCHRLLAQGTGQLLLMEPRAIVYHHVGAERVRWGYLWRRCFFVNMGKVRAFRNMGAAANMDADVTFVLRSLRQSAWQSMRDLFRGDARGLSRFAVLVIAVALAAAGNVAGRLALQLSGS